MELDQEHLLLVYRLVECCFPGHNLLRAKGFLARDRPMLRYILVLLGRKHIVLAHPLHQGFLQVAEEELYNVEQDPGEITNLAAHPDHTAELQQMKLKLLGWMERTKDRVLNLWTRRQLTDV